MRRVAGSFAVVMALAGCSTGQPVRVPLVAAPPPSAAWQNRAQMGGDLPAAVVGLPPAPPPALQPGQPAPQVAHIAQVGQGAQFTTVGASPAPAQAAPPVAQAAAPRRFPLAEVPDVATSNLIAVTHTESQRDPLPLAAPAAPLPPAVALAPAGDGPVIDVGPRQGVSITPALRLVNSRRFNLGFELKEVTGNQLELWTTTDTRVWRLHETAQLKPGACVVEVPGEGTFGFTLVSRTTAKPQAGDSPQVWVTVDLTKPAVQLQGVELSLTTRPAGLVVRWSAADKNLGPRPITLAYAEQAQGPWMTMAANLPNSGRYEHPVPENFPRGFFLRVEAMDLSGNTAAASTANAVHLDHAETAKPVMPAAAADAHRGTPVSILAVEPAGN